MGSPIYGVVALGSFGDYLGIFADRLKSAAAEIGLRYPEDLDLIPPDVRCAFTTCVYFCGTPNEDISLLRRLLEKQVPIIPACPQDDGPRNLPPSEISTLHCISLSPTEESADQLARAVLESFHLVAASRRVFISYRRKSASKAASELADELGRRGFGVFLDTRSTRSGEDFPTVIAHRLSDSDVFLMLVSDREAASRWMDFEIRKALGSHIGVVSVVWPELTQPEEVSVAREIVLEARDVLGEGLSPGALDRVCQAVEQVRALSTRLRHDYLQAMLSEYAERTGGHLVAGYPGAVLSIDLPNRPEIGQAYIALGIPRSETLHSLNTTTGQKPVLLFFDNAGASMDWREYWEWLVEKVGFATCLTEEQITRRDANSE